MFNQLPDSCFKLPVIIPEYSRIAQSTYTRVIPLMMQFLVLKCVSTYTRGRLTSIHEYIRYICYEQPQYFSEELKTIPFACYIDYKHFQADEKQMLTKTMRCGIPPIYSC